MIRICPLTQLDLSTTTLEKLISRLKGTTTVTEKTLVNALRNKFGLQSQAQGKVALVTEYAQIAINQAQAEFKAPSTSRPSMHKRTSPIPPSTSSHKKARRTSTPSIQSEQSVEEQFPDASFSDFSPSPPPAFSSKVTPAVSGTSGRKAPVPQSKSSVDVKQRIQPNAAGSRNGVAPSPLLSNWARSPSDFSLSPSDQATPAFSFKPTPGMTNASARHVLTPQSRSSTNVNVASTAVKRVQSSAAGSRYGAAASSPTSNWTSSPADAEVLAQSPPHPSRLDFSGGKGDGKARGQARSKSKGMPICELLVVTSGAILAIWMSSFVDTGMTAVDVYSAPAAPRLDTQPAVVRACSPSIFGALEWSCRAFRPFYDAATLASRINSTDITEKDVMETLKYQAQQETVIEFSADGRSKSASRYASAAPCGVTLLCRITRIAWLLVPIILLMVDLVLRWKILHNARLFAAGIVYELKLAAQVGRSLASTRLKADLIESLDISGTHWGIESAWRKASKAVFQDKRLHKFAQVDGGEQTEMWQFKSGTARALNADTNLSKPRTSIFGVVYDVMTLVPRALAYAGGMFLFYKYIVL